MSKDDDEKSKMRRYRARRRAGKAVLPIEIELGPVSDLLVQQKFLREWDDGDRSALKFALEEYLRVQATYA